MALLLHAVVTVPGRVMSAEPRARKIERTPVPIRPGDPVSRPITEDRISSHSTWRGLIMFLRRATRRSAKRTRRVPMVEALEPKCLLAGNVKATVVNGSLNIVGDNLSNDI